MEMLDKGYKFYLSFENSLCSDYVTEKFWKILKFNIVPVVLGGADYSKVHIQRESMYFLHISEKGTNLI